MVYVIFSFYVKIMLVYEQEKVIAQEYIPHWQIWWSEGMVMSLIYLSEIKSIWVWLRGITSPLMELALDSRIMSNIHSDALVMTWRISIPTTEHPVFAKGELS